MNILTKLKYLILKLISPVIIFKIFFTIAMLRLIQLEEDQYLKIVEIIGLLITLITSISEFYMLIFGKSIIMNEEND